MNRWIAAILIGLGLSAVAYGQEDHTRLAEVPMETAGGHPFRVPEHYGHLVDVVISGEVQYLYFEDQVGALRIVLVGPRSAIQRSRASLDLLATDVFLIKRAPTADGS